MKKDFINVLKFVSREKNGARIIFVGANKLNFFNKVRVLI